MVDAIVTALQVSLGVGGVLAIVRAIRGPELVDRIVALDLVLLLLAAGIAAEGARDGAEVFLPVLVVVTLIAFAGTVVVARFVEWRDAP